jgi:ABC-type multidrug transport system fused ATPase/permease subunit
MLNLTITTSDILTVVGWNIALISFLIASIISLFMWMSRRELDKNEKHQDKLADKTEKMEAEHEKYLALHLEVMNEKIKNLNATDIRNETKSEEADKEIKATQGLSRLNERDLFKQDEEQTRARLKEFSDLKAEIAALKSLGKK